MPKTPKTKHEIKEEIVDNVMQAAADAATEAQGVRGMARQVEPADRHRSRTPPPGQQRRAQEPDRLNDALRRAHDLCSSFCCCCCG